MQGYWNYTEEITYRVIVVRLLEIPDKPLWWQNVYAGEHRQVVEVTSKGGHVFLIDNADGSGLAKIAAGGGPHSPHRSIDGHEFVGLVPDDMAQQWSLEKCLAIEAHIDNWQRERYPEEWERLQGLRKTIEIMQHNRRSLNNQIDRP